MKYWSYTLLFVAFLGFEANATCVDCHAGQAATLESTPHIALQSDTDSAGSCIACHGTGSEHMTNPFAGGVLAFAAESAQEKSAACGSCHTESHNANRSVHARAGIACTDCHAVHSPADAAAALPGFENLEPDLQTVRAATRMCSCSSPLISATVCKKIRSLASPAMIRTQRPSVCSLAHSSETCARHAMREKTVRSYLNTLLRVLMVASHAIRLMAAQTVICWRIKTSARSATAVMPRSPNFTLDLPRSVRLDSVSIPFVQTATSQFTALTSTDCF